MAGEGLLRLLEKAFVEVFAHGRIPPKELTNALISKGLGYGILAGSTLVKVPQLLNVVRAKSADGLNPFSFELETIGLVIATTYGFLMRLPFSAFGEVVALLIQNNILLLMIYSYQRRSMVRTFTFAVLLISWAAAVLSGMVTREQMSALYDFNNFILVVARVPQILQNFSSQSTGQLSLITYALNWAGATARIFTGLQEGAGAAMVRGAAISAFLNFVVAAQIMIYGKGSSRRAKAVKKE